MDIQNSLVQLKCTGCGAKLMLPCDKLEPKETGRYILLGIEPLICEYCQTEHLPQTGLSKYGKGDVGDNVEGDLFGLDINGGTGIAIDKGEKVEQHVIIESDQDSSENINSRLGSSKSGDEKTQSLINSSRIIRNRHKWKALFAQQFYL